MGETEDYSATDHVATINKYLRKRKIDAVIVANSKIPKDIIEKYIAAENKNLVKYDKKSLKDINCELIAEDLLTIDGNYIRHDDLKLATCIFNYLMR
jgi:2-phospho-L-lactate transferase/gluconeogenesis factor (CofD/UPF0052 family)